MDGSPAPLYEAHARAWKGIVRHVPPDPDLSYANGKVNGVVTGMRRVVADRVVIADDDVRYDGPALTAVLALPPASARGAPVLVAAGPAGL
ncbi:hypothetical protein [Actinoallomurus iriomotensis]|uniref:Uncharacterized protein n=1 Tax=Actinoallomurus iriomotensis TaxID=478107 RepID=A0A9W6VXD6_9ACTN|nr:hypothetical protein [Actinoallomurus iriomotensis]GLY88823.1 hypothetical protein Airi02_067520 [Actinoallomurus iriomotensis]